MTRQAIADTALAADRAARLARSMGRDPAPYIRERDAALAMI